MGFSDVDSDNKPMSFQQTCEKKMAVHQQELSQKEEEMKQQFIQRVKEKEAQLKEAEREVSFSFQYMLLIILKFIFNLNFYWWSAIC